MGGTVSLEEVEGGLAWAAGKSSPKKCVRNDNPRDAGGARIVFNQRMNLAFLHELMPQQPEIARRWRTGLKDMPSYTALGNPDTMMFLIAPTLQRLFALAQERPEASWSPQAAPMLQLVEAVSRCALNPMIGFYLAGEAALGFVVRSIPTGYGLSESDVLLYEGELLALLRGLGRDEVTSFCEICLIEAPSSVASRPRATIPTTCPFKAAQRHGESAAR